MRFRAVHRILRLFGVDRGGNVLWRRLLVAFTIAAFAQQSYLTQTHIHVPASLGAPNGNLALSGTTHGKVPAPDDPAHCPFCQEILIAGAFLTPAAIIVLPPVLPAFRVELPARKLPVVAAASHNWQGRAPPSA